MKYARKLLSHIKHHRISSHIDEEDNHYNYDDENPEKSPNILVSMAHQINIRENRVKSEFLAKLREMKEKITHEKILLISIGEYVKKENFFPPSINE